MGKRRIPKREDDGTGAFESSTSASFAQKDLLTYIASFSSDFASHAQQANLPRLAMLLELVHREAVGKR